MKKTLTAWVAAAITLTSAPAFADLVVPNLSYRTGAYAANGIPYADGFNDYFTLLNERDGGIGGEMVKTQWTPAPILNSAPESSVTFCSFGTYISA